MRVVLGVRLVGALSRASAVDPSGLAEGELLGDVAAAAVVSGGAGGASMVAGAAAASGGGDVEAGPAGAATAAGELVAGGGDVAELAAGGDVLAGELAPGALVVLAGVLELPWSDTTTPIATAAVTAAPASAASKRLRPRRGPSCVP